MLREQVTKLLILVMTQRLTLAQVLWDYGPIQNGGTTSIPNALTLLHVSGIVLGICNTDGSIFTLNILGPDGTHTAYPTGGCSETITTQTLPITTDQRVTYVRVEKSANLRLYSITIGLKDLGTMITSTQVYTHSNSGQQFQTYSYYIPQGYEFSGFNLASSFNGCIIGHFEVIYRPLVCTVTFDLSLINGMSQAVITSPGQYRQFSTTTAPGLDCTTAAFDYDAGYSPSNNITYFIDIGYTSVPLSVYFRQATQPGHGGVYTVYVYARIRGQSSWLSPAATATYTYTSVCDSTVITVAALSPMTNSILNFVSGSPYYATQTATASETAGTAYGSPICGSLVLSISSTTSVAALSATELNFNPTTGVISLYTANTAAIGTHTVTISASLPTKPAIPAGTATFIITIEPCIVTSFTMSTLSTKTYYIPNPALTWSYVGTSITTQVPSCGYSVQFTDSGTPSLVTVSNSGSTMSLSAQSSSFLDVGTYPITITATLVNYIFTPARTTPTQSRTFNFVATGSCNTTPTTLIAPIITSMSTSVLFQSGGGPFYVTQTTVFTDTVSVANGDNVITCGNRQYSITSTPSSGVSSLSSTDLTIDPSTGLIKLYTANKATIGTHTGTVTSKLVSYPSLASKSSSFTITINPCILTAFTMSALSAQTYTIGNIASSWQITSSLVTTQVPACGYATTVYSLNIPVIVTATSQAPTITISTFSRDYKQAGVYHYQVESVVNNYPYTSLPVTPQQTIILTAIDPCLTAQNQIIPSTVEDLVAFVGYSATTQIKYKFTDTASLIYTKEYDDVDFCGEKQTKVTINGTSTSLLKVQNDDYIYFDPPASTQSFGVGQAKIEISMNSHPTVKSTSASFKAVILGLIIPKIQNQFYEWGSQKLLIEFEPFQVNPPTYDAGLNAVQAYIFTGNQIPNRIDFDCGCLIRASEFDWITFDNSMNSLAVYTSNGYNMGKYTVFLVQSFQNFPEVNPFTYFSVIIQPIDKPPYFQQELAPLNITQCPGPSTTLWSFSIPKIIDPNKQTVTISFNFDNTIFTYDRFENQIKQVRAVKAPQNETIYITLKNRIDKKATYSMNLHFVCNITKNLTFLALNQTESSEVEQKQIIWPQARIQKIEPSGLLRIKFLQKMRVPDRQQLLEMNSTLDRVIDLKFIPGKQTDLTMGKFNWTLVDYTSSELLIQLEFEHLSYISSNPGYSDSMNLTILDTQLFIDIEGKVMQSPTILPLKELPKLASKKSIDTAQLQSKQTKTVLTSAVVILVFSGPIQKILSSIKHSQIVVHLVLISVSYPAVVLVFFGGLMDLINFQFIDFTSFYNTVLRLDPDSIGNNPLNSQFELMGYDALYIVQNFGMLLLTVILPFIARFSAHIAFRIGKVKFAPLVDKTQKWLRYGFWISFLDDTYLFLLVCTFLNLGYYFKWQRGGDVVNCLISLLSAALLIIFIVFISIFYRMKKNYNLIQQGNSDFRERFCSVVNGLNFKRRGHLALLYPFMQLIRKFWLALLLVFSKDHCTWSILSVTVQALIMAGVTGLVEPMTLVSDNRMQLLNESFILVFCYHLFPLTNFMTDLDARNVVGNSLMVLTVLNLGLNISLTISQNLSPVARRLKLMIAKCKHSREIRKKELQMQLLKSETNQNQPQTIPSMAEIELSDKQLSLKINRAEKAVQQQLQARFESQNQDDLKLDELFELPKVDCTVIQPNQPDYRDFYLTLLSQYSNPNHSDDKLNPTLVKRCQNIVYENKLGVDLRPIGRIQGPFPATTLQSAKREVLFVFNRQLQEKDLWSPQKQRLMAQAAVNNPAVSLFNAPNSVQRNLVDLKAKNSFLKSANDSIHKSLGQTQKPFLYILQSSDSKHKVLERGDSLENLKKQFPCLVQQKVVLTRTTEFYKKLLQVYLIKVDVEFVRFGILVDGKDSQMVIPTNGDKSEAIEQQLIKVMKIVDQLAHDFPNRQYDDILSGKFAERIALYRGQQAGRRPNNFVDFGEVPLDMDFEKLVTLYQKICNSDEQQQKVSNMCENGLFFFS